MSIHIPLAEAHHMVRFSVNEAGNKCFFIMSPLNSRAMQWAGMNNFLTGKEE